MGPGRESDGRPTDFSGAVLPPAGDLQHNRQVASRGVDRRGEVARRVGDATVQSVLADLNLTIPWETPDIS